MLGVTGALLEDIEAAWLSGQPIDPAQYCTLVNSQRRLLETVGLKRQARDVTPKLGGIPEAGERGTIGCRTGGTGARCS